MSRRYLSALARELMASALATLVRRLRAGIAPAEARTPPPDGRLPPGNGQSPSADRATPGSPEGALPNHPREPTRSAATPRARVAAPPLATIAHDSRLRRAVTAVAWIIGAALVGAAVGIGAGEDPKVAATVGLAAAGLILVFLRPDWLPTALVATVFAEGISVGGLQISRVAAPIAVFIVLMRLAAQGRVAPLGPLRVLFAVGAYGAWALASTLWTDYPGSASTTYSGTAYALSSLALSLVYMLSCAALIERSQDLWRVARMVWLMSTVVGVIAVTEYILGSPRSLGLTGDANFFAALQVVALPIGVALATTVRRGPRQSVVLLGVAVTVCSILTSLSRGGILALGGVALLVLLQPSRTFFRDRRLKRALLVATAVAGATLLALSYADASRDLSRELSNRGWSIFNTGGSGRRFVWRAAIAGWREHPVRGLGYGAFIPQSNVLLRRTPGVDLDAYRLRPAGTLVHNAYLGSLAELGVIGLVLFLAVLAAAWSTLRRIVRQAEAEGQHSLATLVRALTLSLVGFALTSIFLSTETDRALWVLLGITLALPRLLPSVAALEGPSSPPGNLALRRRPRPATA